MKKILIAALGLGLSVPVLAQQRPQYSQYMLNNYLLNPAVAGIDDFGDARLGMRRQWVGLEGAPVTYYATMHVALGKKDRIVQTPFSLFSRKGRRNYQNSAKPTSRLYKVTPHHGVGAQLELDKTGPLSTKSFKVTYAYHQPLSQSLRLSLGMTGGLLQYSLNREELKLVNQNDPIIGGNQSNFDLGVGAWLYAQNFYLGVSSQQLLKNHIDFSGGGFSEGRLQAHHFITAGGRVQVSEDFSFVPSVLVKLASPSPATLDVNVKGVYAETVWAGISYRQNDAVSAMAGGNITPRLSASYAYDFTTSDLNRVSSGSHEIVVGIRVGPERGASKWLPWW